MEAQTRRPKTPHAARDRLRGAWIGALAAALCLSALLMYPPVRGIFYKGFGRIEDPLTFDYAILGDGSVTLTKYTGGAAVVTVPAEVDGNPVKTLHSFVFVDQTYIARVVISEGIERIDAMAMLFCPGLSEIVIPASVTEIAPNAFSSCAEDLILFAPPGSAAEAYAAKYNLVFVPRG
ncbi:MAG: leucine-rich repeat domain-containing protein [Oscillospiraceae bacterium]|nr:leucine-rich repeat domain-containing protein [Oscillospiraceae bacterium]